MTEGEKLKQVQESRRELADVVDQLLSTKKMDMVMIQNEIGRILGPYMKRVESRMFADFMEDVFTHGSIDGARAIHQLILPDFSLTALGETRTTHGTWIFYSCAMGDYRSGCTGAQEYSVMGLANVSSLAMAYFTCMMKILAKERRGTLLCE